MQLQAGFMLDCVKEVLEAHNDKAEITGLLTQLSYFDVKIVSSANYMPGNEGFEQLLAVANNIISRGLPTRPSLWVENELLKNRKLTIRDEKAYEIGTIS